MKEPNIFKYATSELSQDAFICWLLEWANKTNANNHTELHSAGKAMLNALLSKADNNKAIPLAYDTIDIYKQYKNIDVLVIINNEYALIIEDKTRTSNHSGQLERYFEEISQHGVKKEYLHRTFDTQKIIPIYFKTHDQSDYRDIEVNGYFPFTRKDILGVLRKNKNGCCDNAIYENFLAYLEEMEASIESYRFKPIDKWKDDWAPCIGFFKAIQPVFPDAFWGYVNNASGGFMHFTWGDHMFGENHVFMMLHNTELHFRVHATGAHSGAERGALRATWHDILLSSTSPEGITLRKPTRFGNGEYMTCAVVQDWLPQTSGGTVDMDAAIKLLQAATSYHEECLHRATKHLV